MWRLISLNILNLVIFKQQTKWKFFTFTITLYEGIQIMFNIPYDGTLNNGFAPTFNMLLNSKCIVVVDYHPITIRVYRYSNAWCIVPRIFALHIEWLSVSFFPTSFTLSGSSSKWLDFETALQLIYNWFISMYPNVNKLLKMQPFQFSKFRWII